MAFTVAIILSMIVGQVICAPSGCVEVCNRLTGSLNTQTPEAQQNGLPSLGLHASQVNLDYSRPGNWTEHNDYKTNNGAGQVHEEKGQFVNGAAKVRYYKKNYSTSYGSNPGVNNNEFRNVNVASMHHDSNLLNTQNTIGHLNQQNYRRHSSYSDQHSGQVRHSTGDLISDSARLEDLDDHSDTTQVHGISGTSGVIGSDNWSRHNTYMTDGGRGKVYEERGEYSQGPAKVHYYKKNYTSSYSSGSATPVIPAATISDVDAQVHQLQSQLDQIGQEILQSGQLSQNVYSENLDRGAINSGYDHHHQRQGYTYNQNGVRPATSTGNERYEQHSTTNVKASNDYVPVQSITQTPYMHSQTSQVHHQGFQQQTYVPTSQRLSHTSYHHQSQQHRSNEDSAHVPLYHENHGNNNFRDESGSYPQYQQVTGQSQVLQHDLTGHENLQHGIYNQEIGGHVVQPEMNSHVEEHWSTSKHKTEFALPQQTISRQGLNSHRLDTMAHQQYRIPTIHEVSGSSSSSFNQHYGSASENLHSTALHLGHQEGDCATESRIKHGSQLQRRDKREIEFSQQHEDLTQQTQDLTQQTQILQDYTQQQQEMAGLELGQQIQQHNDHYSHNNNRREQQGESIQQNENWNQYNQHDMEDYTQQQSGHFQFDQQHQQHTDGLEFGQQTQQEHHGEYTHQSENLTQQRREYDNYALQQHSRNFESDPLHHQRPTDGFELRQQTRENLDRHNTHQTQDLTQQTQSGTYQFGQEQDQGLIQQSSYGINGFERQQGDDLTQQTSSKLEFERQAPQLDDSQHNGQEQDQGLIQQSSYGINGFERQQSADLTQQTSSKLEFEQQPSQFDDSQYNEHFHESKPAPKPTSRTQRVSHLGGTDTEIEFNRPVGVKGGRPRISQQQVHSQYSNQVAAQSQGVLSLEEQVQHTQNIGSQWPNAQLTQDLTRENIGDVQRHDALQATGNQASEIIPEKVVIQSRILEAYGGTGPYNVDHHENIFSGVKPNPTATLTPNIAGSDPWDIREISSGDLSVNYGPTATAIPESQDDSTTSAPGFWKRVGHKLTNAFDKTKEKVSDIFG